jgi:hypothetical protein
MKNTTLYIALILVILGLGYIWFSESKPELISNPDGIGGPSYLERTSTAPATTTVVWMTPGTASTTLSINSSYVDKVDIYVQQTSSTSNSVLTTSFEVSNNNVDWTVASTSNWSGSASASTTRFVLSFPDYVSNFKRVVFTNTTAGVSLWSEAILKSSSY